jgi:ribosome-interacting GTPase 1
MMEFEDVQVQLVDTPAIAEGHTEPYLPNLAHDADGVLLVLDVTANDAEAVARLLHDLLARARVWPRTRPLPPDAPPFLQPKPVLVLGNKAEEDDGTFAALAREAIGADLPFLPVSALTGAGLETLREVLFRELKRIRVYAKEPGRKPDLARPFVLPEGATIHDLATHVHKEIAESLKFARLWGHARFDGQQVDRHHVLADKDVVELHA